MAYGQLTAAELKRLEEAFGELRDTYARSGSMRVGVGQRGQHRSGEALMIRTAVSARLIAGAPVALVDHARAERSGLDQVQRDVFGDRRQERRAATDDDRIAEHAQLLDEAELERRRGRPPRRSSSRSARRHVPGELVRDHDPMDLGEVDVRVELSDAALPVVALHEARFYPRWHATATRRAAMGARFPPRVRLDRATDRCHRPPGRVQRRTDDLLA